MAEVNQKILLKSILMDIVFALQLTQGDEWCKSMFDDIDKLEEKDDK